MTKNNQTIFKIAFTIIATVLPISLIIWAYSTTGFAGLVAWEYFAVAMVVFTALCAVVAVILGILSLKFPKLNVIFCVYSAIITVAVIAVFSTLSVLNNGKNLDCKLNFYSSSDSYLTDFSDDEELNIAVVSDSHYGASSSSPEARHDIMNYISKSGYDLTIHGGDVVDVGSNKSYYKEAIADMEEYFGTQKIHFVEGNHDILVGSSKNFHNAFQKGETSENHVLELAPNVHWVIFNMIGYEDDVTEDSLKWLEKTLSSYPASDCVVVQSHGYYYATGGSLGKAKWYDFNAMIAKVCPIFERYGVDIVVSGHIHTMEHMTQNSVNYILVGPFGGSTYAENSIPTQAESYFRDGTHHGFTTFSVSDGSVIVTFRDQNGNPLYNTTIKYN